MQAGESGCTGMARTARLDVWSVGERGPGAASSCAAHPACGAMWLVRSAVLDTPCMTTDLTSTALMLQVWLLAKSAWQAAAHRSAPEWPARRHSHDVPAGILGMSMLCCRVHVSQHGGPRL